MKRNKLKIRDLFFVALYGVKARKGRATLTSIGIGIGIAAIVAVSGISASGRADLLSTLESLGTNLVKASPQAGFFGTQEELPKGVLGMVERIGPVQEVTSTTQTDLLVRRSNFISQFEGGGISTIVTSAELLDVIGGVNGDPTQIDLPNKNMSGLVRSKELLGHLNEISVVDFDHSDVVRHPLVSKIVKAYSKND